MNWLEEEMKYFLNVFKRLPIEVTHGSGCYLYDRQGDKYLDFLGGLGVNALGYSHPDVLNAIETQIRKNLHLSNYFVQGIQIEFARKILELSGYSRLFFSNSGTESIEGILKLVKKWANVHNKHQIICFDNSFHGRSLGALSVTAQEKYQKNVLPLLPQIEHVPFNSPQELKKIAGPHTAAIFLEFIQGEGGVVPATSEFVDVISQVQREHNVLVVADEIQSGVSRTGKFLAFQHYNIEPDLVSIAKAIGGGLPLGAFLVNEKLKDVLSRGEHGTTFGGNPVSCAAGFATLEVIEKEGLADHAFKMGEYLHSRLRELMTEYPELLLEVRGIGLMQGIQMNIETYPIVLAGLKEGVIFNSTAGNVLRFLPPLLIQESQIDEGIDVLREILQRQTAV